MQNNYQSNIHINNTDIKIFFNDRVVILTGKDVESSPIDRKQVYCFQSKKELRRRLQRFEQSVEELLFITHSDLNELVECVKKCFIYVEAAGGVVMLPDGRMLIIRRLGKWDLPKGKAEKGESLNKTALREVMEECGLEKTPTITSHLTDTFHTYRLDGKQVLKRTAWYTMLYEGNEKLQPQYDEDITDAVWFTVNRLEKVMQNTYQSIKEVLSAMIDSSLQLKLTNNS